MRLLLLLVLSLFVLLPKTVQSQSPCITVADELLTLYDQYYWETDSLQLVCDSIFILAEECDSDSLRGTGYLIQGDVYYNQSSLDSAAYFYREAADYFNKAGDTMGIMDVHFNLGNIYSEMGQIEEATSHYLSALPYFEQQKDTATIALVHYNISLLFFDQNNLKGAKRRLNIAKGLCEPNYLQGTIYADILQMLGHLHFLNGEHDSAKMLLFGALDYVDSNMIEQYEGYSFANLGLIFLDEGTFDSAHIYIDKANHIAHEAEDHFSQASYLSLKADVLAEEARYDEALAVIDSALQIAQSIRSLVLREMSLEIKADIYEKMGDYESAYLYQDSTYVLRDSIQQQNAEASILHYEREKRIEQNQALEAENKLIDSQRALKEQQLKERSLLLMVIAILLGLLFIASAYLYRLSRKRKRLNDAKDTILSVISHDLRGPIVQMKSLSDLLSEPHIEEKNKIAILQNFNIAISNLQKSFENILFWSKTQMQGLHVDTQRINLCQAIQEMVDFHQQSLAVKSIVVDNNLQDNVFVHADPNHLQIALRNILSNAIKFSDRGATVYVSCGREDNYGFIQVRDEGIGIEPEAMRQILNKRISYSRIGTTNEKGTGLGVMLSKQFIQANKGEYIMESEVGKGTTVTLKLPLDKRMV